jgi:hypothetical protein
MATDQDVLDFLRSLFTDSATVKALATNPAQTFQDCRVADATPNQMNSMLATLATSPGALPPALQGRLEAAISSGGGGLFADVGYRGAVPTVLASATPLVAGYAQTAAALTAVTSPPSIVQQVSNVTNVDESTHITDDSVNQHILNIGGTLTNNIASGAGAVAIGGDADGATIGTGSGPVIGQDSDVDHTIFAGDAPITHSTLVAGDNEGSISGQDDIHGSRNITDAGLTGTNVDSIGTTAEGASQGSALGGDGSNLNVDSPGAANASGLGQAAGGGEGGGQGGVNLGGDNLVQQGQTNVNAPNSLGVQASGGGDNAQNAQNQEGFGTGGDPGLQVQTAQLTPDGGGDGPVYFDQSAPPDPGLGAPDPGISQPPADPGYSDQPAGTEHTDPLG